MLPKANRLPSSLVGLVLRSGAQLHDESMVMRLQKNFLPITRFAVVVSSSVDKRSTKRNIMKRAIRQAIQNGLPRIIPGWDIVFIAKRNIRAKDQNKISDSIMDLLVRSKTVDLRQT